MNTPVKQQYEDWMGEDEIAIYDHLVSLGRVQIGKELSGNEEFLLHLSALITLKQMKGMMISMDDPAILELKRIHKEHHEAGLVFETPPDAWYASANALKEPYIPEEIQKDMDALTLKEQNKNNIENEVVDETIKKDWVKLVEPPIEERSS
jgi:hypothetical protein